MFGSDTISSFSHQQKRMVSLTCGRWQLPESQHQQQEVCRLRANATIPKNKSPIVFPVCSIESCPVQNRTEMRGGSAEKRDLWLRPEKRWSCVCCSHSQNSLHSAFTHPLLMSPRAFASRPLPIAKVAEAIITMIQKWLTNVNSFLFQILLWKRLNICQIEHQNQLHIPITQLH